MDRVSKFAKDNNLTYKILLMGGKMSPKLYGVTSAPTGFWIDHEGTVLRREIGFDPSHIPAMESRIERLIAKRAAAKK